MTENEKLQFDRAEHAEGGAAISACGNCRQPITGSYYEVNGVAVCERCRGPLEAAWNRGTSVGRFAKALGLGLIASLVGAGIYYAILALTGYEIGLVAIVVGLLVGSAVKKGSNGRGGWRYQALAIFLTYSAIVSTYVPLIIKEVRKQDVALLSPDSSANGGAASLRDTAGLAAATGRDSSRAAGGGMSTAGFLVALVVFAGFVYALPFIAGLENIIGLLIIGFALYEAWKLNQRAELRITGPYKVGAGPAPQTASR
ncbi:MAG: hypothetical protein ACREL9_07325 [Gemmatimonadales bacterium]